jgi:CheY-like chemotaxis protein
MKRVLIVDGYPDSAHRLARLLAEMGHQARPCASGFEALYVAAEFLPEVALIDAQMPGLGGAEVMRGLRSVPGLERCRMVAMSGLQAGDKKGAPDGEFDLLLPKPVDPDELGRLLAGPPG